MNKITRRHSQRNKFAQLPDSISIEFVKPNGQQALSVEFLHLVQAQIRVQQCERIQQGSRIRGQKVVQSNSTRHREQRDCGKDKTQFLL